MNIFPYAAAPTPNAEENYTLVQVASDGRFTFTTANERASIQLAKKLAAEG